MQSFKKKQRLVLTLSYLKVLIPVFQAWDSKRSERITALDALLDSLGSQLVPLALHETASDSSLFGSQHSHSDQSDSHTALAEPQAQNQAGVTATDRGKWRSLRYFVDERSIEDALDRIEEDRNALDVSRMLNKQTSVAQCI